MNVPLNISTQNNQYFFVFFIASALLDFFSLKSHCKVKCLNGGTCHPPYKCKCPPAYHGNMCQYGKWYVIFIFIYFLTCHPKIF